MSSVICSSKLFTSELCYSRRACEYWNEKPAIQDSAHLQVMVGNHGQLLGDSSRNKQPLPELGCSCLDPIFFVRVACRVQLLLKLVELTLYRPRQASAKCPGESQSPHFRVSSDYPELGIDRIRTRAVCQTGRPYRVESDVELLR